MFRPSEEASQKSGLVQELRALDLKQGYAVGWHVVSSRLSRPRAISVTYSLGSLSKS